jgi:hypothetical protein
VYYSVILELSRSLVKSFGGKEIVTGRYWREGDMSLIFACGKYSIISSIVLLFLRWGGGFFLGLAMSDWDCGRISAF